MSESSSNINQESKESDILILRIRSPSETAYLNGINHASSVDQFVEKKTYLTPSMLPQDKHSDLEATSPKLKFGETKIHEYISLSPMSPNQNINITSKSKETNPSTPKMK